jgi:mono/diheme cytochrome c family protein
MERRVYHAARRFRMRRFVLVAGLGLGGCAAHVTTAQVDAVLALQGDSTHGATVYADNCVECHGTDGKKEKSAVLPDKIPANTDADVVGNILSGPWIMPNFVHKLSNQDVADVLAYLRATYGAGPGDTGS